MCSSCAEMTDRFDARHPMTRTAVSAVMSVDVCRVEPRRPSGDAAWEMARNRASCLVVCDKNRPVGIVTESDLASACARNGLSRESLQTVGQLMSTPVETVSERASLHEALVKLDACGFHQLPVIDDRGELVGLLTQSELVRAWLCTSSERSAAACAGALGRGDSDPLRSSRG